MKGRKKVVGRVAREEPSRAKKRHSASEESEQASATKREGEKNAR